jgi:hypothetical protein
MLRFMELGIKLKKQKQIFLRITGSIILSIAVAFTKCMEWRQKDEEIPKVTEEMDRELLKRIRELNNQKKKDNIK